MPDSELRSPLPEAMVAVVCNPRSGRVARNVREVRSSARALAGGAYREASEPREIADAALTLANEADALCVIGGDGTLQAVLTALAIDRPADRWPVLAPVPGGSTNMSARDLGVRGTVRECLDSIGAWASDPDRARRVVRRPAVTVREPDGTMRSGLFFGAGAVSAGVDFFRRRLHGSGLSGGKTSGLTLARVMLSMAVNGRDTRATEYPVSARADGREMVAEAAALCVVTTLDRLILGTRPYWGSEAAPLHFTLVERRARGFWRNIPRVWVGSGDRLAPEDGYFSLNAHSITLEFDGPYVIDGEIYRADSAAGPLDLSALPEIAWLTT